MTVLHIWWVRAWLEIWPLGSILGRDWSLGQDFQSCPQARGPRHNFPSYDDRWKVGRRRIKNVLSYSSFLELKTWLTFIFQLQTHPYTSRPQNNRHQIAIHFFLVLSLSLSLFSLSLYLSLSLYILCTVVIFAQDSRSESWANIKRVKSS